MYVKCERSGACALLLPVDFQFMNYVLCCDEWDKIDGFKQNTDASRVHNTLSAIPKSVKIRKPKRLTQVLVLFGPVCVLLNAFLRNKKYYTIYGRHLFYYYICQVIITVYK
jgi:hypothetical protein